MVSNNPFFQSPLAIVGIGLRLPGADSVEAYWELVHSGRHAIRELPESRLCRARYYQPGDACPGKTYTQLGGIVPLQDLDTAALGLSEAELGKADPAHLLFLDTVLAALRHGHIDPPSLRDSRVGVYVGHARGSTLIADLTYSASVEALLAEVLSSTAFASLPAAERAQLAAQISEQTHDRYPRFAPDGGPFTQPSAAAGLVARRLQTTGPYMAVDAACASSFAALDLAARALHAGEIEAAIVGGCSYNQWSSLVLFSQAQALSRNGSFPFDERADGFISSDGYAAIIVEPLARAQAAGRQPLALLRGVGGSCDGRGKSLWAPLQEGQVAAITRAYDEQLRPDSVQVLEAHATGTAVGDATEVAALLEVFGPALAATPAGEEAARAKLPISSVKANIGHTRETAGLAGLIKMVLAMHKGIVPPAASFHTPSSRIDWSAIPFRVPTSAEPWPDRPGAPRRAAIDAFGIGGLNYHVVIDAPERAAPAAVLASRPAAAASEPIALLGIGIILPGAPDLPAFLQTLAQPAEPTQPDPARWPAALYEDPQGGPYRLRQTRGHFLRGWQLDWRKYKIPPRQVEQSDPLQLMLIDAVAQALSQAGYTQEELPHHLRTAVYTGSIFGGDFTTRLNIGMRAPELAEDVAAGLARLGVAPAVITELAQAAQQALLQHYPLEDQSGSFSASTLASRIAKYFDLGGPCSAIDAEEASGLAALSASLSALRSGACDVALCCAGQRLLHNTRFMYYERLGVLAGPQQPGCYLSEGAVALVLRRQSDALRDGQPILALLHEVAGAASAAGPGPALQQAMRRALDRAQPKAPPALIECCTTGIASLEAAEKECLKQSYGAQAPAPVSAMPKLGMAQGASALVGLVHLLASAAPSARTPVALNSIGLGGLAFHALLEAAALPQQTASVVASLPAERADAPRIIRLAAPSLDALRSELGDADAALLFQAARAPGRFAPDDAWRLALVASSPAALQAKLALLHRAGESVASSELWPTLHEQGIFLHQKPAAPPMLAFAFAGQGSQYAGMLQQLCQQHAVTQPVLAEIDEVLAELGEPRFAEIVWETERAEALGSDTFYTQLAVLGGDVLMHSVLRSMQLSPAFVFAHSYGEYPALFATGAWSLRTAIRATHARCQALTALGPPPGKLISTAAPVAELAALTQRFAARGLVAPANFNSPEQTVLAVQTALVDEVLAVLAERGHAAQLLPVPQPYHSALLAAAQPALAQVLDALPLQPPRTPFLSGIGNSYVADPEELRRRLVSQLTEPLRFTELVRRAYRDGARVFLEVGPRSVLTRLVRSILKGQPALALCTDHPKVAAAEQLLRVQALLQTQDLWPEALPERTPAQLLLAGPTAYAQTRRLPEPVSASLLLHFDATEHRRKKLAEKPAAHAPAHEVPTAHAPISEASTPSAEPLTDMERFLVNFVCEQTGYPAEVVGLDQDLEADLGIDSIKKAQMLGELRDQFKLQLPSTGRSGLSLAKLLTLRDVSRLLAGQQASAPQSPAPRPAVSSPVPAAPASPRAHALVRVQRLHGSRFEMGKQHGALFAEEIERTLQRYRDLLGGNVLERPEIQAFLSRDKEFFDEPARQELAGIAAGSHLPYERIVAYNLGQEPDSGLFGCSQVVMRSGAHGLLHAANEDSPIALRLGNQLVRYVAVRHPDGTGGARHACAVFSSPGQLGGINGINAAGLCVSSTMLLDQKRDLSAVGVLHPCLVLRLLEEACDVDQATALVQASRRVGAWSLLISHAATARAVYLEYDGERFAQKQVDELLCTTNHSLLLAGDPAPEHSQHRLTRLQSLLAQAAPADIDIEALRPMLRDRMDLGRGRVVSHRTMNTVCRVDNQISFIYAAGPGRLLMTPGPTHGEQQDLYEELPATALWSAPSFAQPATQDAAASDGPRTQMRRFVLRSEAAPAASADAALRPLPTLLLGAGAVAEQLARALGAAGCTVRIAESAAAVDLATFLPQRVIILSALADRAHLGDLAPEQRLEFVQRHALAVFSLVQRWVVALRAAAELAGAELCALTALGGELGFDGSRELLPQGGALSGLLKALRREHPELRLKVIDSPVGEPPALLVRSLLSELTSATPLEVGYVRGRRQRVRMLPRELVPESGPYALQQALSPDAAWLVTGGGRGITSLAARALAERHGVLLHLIGSTAEEPVPPQWLTLDAAGRKQLRQQTLARAREQGQDPQSAWHALTRRIELQTTLHSLRSAGLRFHYHHADLQDPSALQRVVDTARRSGPPLRGILHGAGVEAACELARKTTAGVQATVGSKVLGLLHLLALTTADPIAAIVGFGSVSGRFGGLGQTDYSLASELLAKVLAAHRRDTGVRATTIAWPAWGEAGMAMRPESRLALEAAGQSFMPAAEGIEHLLRELAADLPESEVVFLDSHGLRALDADATALSAQPDEQLAQPLLQGLHQAALLDGVAASGGDIVTECCLDPQRDLFLLDHQFEGSPILPAVIGLELLAETALLGAPPDTPVTLEDFSIHAGLRFFDRRSRRAQIMAQRAGAAPAALWNVRLLADSIGKTGTLSEPGRLFVSAQCSAEGAAPPVWTPPPTAASWQPMRYLDGPQAAEAIKGRRVYHGPALRTLQRLCGEQDEAWGELLAPSPQALRHERPRGLWRLPAALLDGCLVACGAHARQRLGLLSLPAGGQRLTVRHLPAAGQRCTLHVRLSSRTDDHLTYDFTLASDAGEPLLWAAGYRAVIVAQAEEQAND